MKQQREFELQKMIAQYLRTAFPKVKFLSDVRASTRLTIPQQVRQKAVQADGFACPDMIIFAVRHGDAGLFLEIKAESPFKRDGSLKKSDHLGAQYRALSELLAEGYRASFVWNFDRARTLIDWYLK